MLASGLRSLAKWRFRALNLATIKDIPTDRFNGLVDELIASGWKKSYVHDGLDAWIDYGKIVLRRNGSKLTLEWDNWTEGSIEGPASLIAEIASTANLTVSNERRWAEHDNAFPG
jgi:hypothetical protein